MGRLTYSLGKPDDADGIQAVLRATAMDGPIQLSFETTLPHDAPEDLTPVFHQTLVARDDQGSIQGVSTRSGSEMYVNGAPRLMGYFGLLRLVRGYQSGIPLKRGVRFMMELHGDGRVPYYLTSIMEDNHIALRMLTANKPGFFKYDFFCRMITHTLKSNARLRLKNQPPDLQYVNATEADIPTIIQLLKHQGETQQFSPVWTEKTLFHPYSTPGLKPTDFILVKRGVRCVGCGAVWDQRVYRRIRVMGYSRALKVARPFWNVMSPLTGQVKLPRRGSELSHAFLSMIALEDDDPQVFLGLLEAALARARGRSIELLMVGLEEHSPFEGLLTQSIRGIRSPSLIYLVSDPADKIAPLELIEKRKPGLEIALL